MERDSTFGVLVVGTGFIAEHHIAALHASTRARLVGVVDTDPGKVAVASRANGGVPATTDLKEALSWPDVDGVIVCTPNGSHAGIAHTVAAAAKHLMVEKPLATTSVDALSIVEGFHNAGLTLTVAHTHRVYDYALAVKAVLDSGEIGEPRLIRLAILGGWIWGDWSAWVLDPGLSGGHALHNGVHLLDLVTWWMGRRPDSVYARGRRQTASDLPIYDYLEMVLRFGDGGVAQCEMSRAHQPGDLAQRDVLVVGSEGVLALPWDGEPNLVVGQHGITALPPAAGSAFTRQLDGWLDAIGGAPPIVDGRDGYFAVAMAEAVELSIATGEQISLAEVAR